jgi:hypothetical protein
MVIHDKSGRIRSAGAPASAFAGQLHLAAGKNQRVVEVEASQFKALADAQRFSDKGYAARALPAWREFVGSFRIDTKGQLLRQAKKK